MSRTIDDLSRHRSFRSTMNVYRFSALIILLLATSGTATAGKEEGIEAYVDKDWSRAVREFRRATNDDPEDVQAHLYLGMSHSELGHLDDAILAMRAAIDRASPDEAKAIKFVMVNVLFDARRPAEVLELVAELNTPDEDNYMRIVRARMEAQALEDLGRKGQARVVHERILGMLSVLPADDHMLSDPALLGESQVGAGYYDDAADACSRAVMENQGREEDRKKWEPHFCLGRAFAGRGEYAVAEVQYEQALQLIRKDWKKWRVHEQLGVAYEKQGKWAEAIAAYEMAGDSAAARQALERQAGDRGLQPVEDGEVAEALADGTYHALLIAVEDYARDNLDLDEPVADARSLRDVLTSDYRFEPHNVTLLENPDEVAIVEAFENLGARLGRNDNLLVFYAGHGLWREDIQQGYWLPADATTSRATWISNEDIRDYIYGIQTRHTLLISDACFSGGMFKERTAFFGADRAIQELYRSPSRKAMTSGTLTTVPDRSVFLRYLKTRLEENEDRYITADQLFASFRQAVINNSPNKPQYGVIQTAGDEGGEFVFVRRKTSP